MVRTMPCQHTVLLSSSFNRESQLAVLLSMVSTIAAQPTEGPPVG